MLTPNGFMTIAPVQFSPTEGCQLIEAVLAVQPHSHHCTMDGHCQRADQRHPDQRLSDANDSLASWHNCSRSITELSARPFWESLTPKVALQATVLLIVKRWFAGSRRRKSKGPEISGRRPVYTHAFKLNAEYPSKTSFSTSRRLVAQLPRPAPVSFRVRRVAMPVLSVHHHRSGAPTGRPNRAGS